MVLIIGGFAQGKNSFADTSFPERTKWTDFHLYVKNALADGKTTLEITEEITSKITENPDLIIISNELGCGIVPMEKSDREWREVTGRMLCMLAQKAEQVYRVTCGIGVKIK